MNLPAADPPPPNPSIRWEIATAYLAAAAKVGAWALVTALLIRSSRAEFAIFALVRGTLGLLNYTSLGLAPAMIKVLAEAKRETPAHVVEPATSDASPILNYASNLPPAVPLLPEQAAYCSGLAAAYIVGLLGVLVTTGYAVTGPLIHLLPPRIAPLDLQLTIAAVGVGSVLRLMSDAPGAVLQTRQRIALDNGLLIAAELVWVGLSGGMTALAGNPLLSAALAYLLSGGLLLLVRLFAAHRLVGIEFRAYRVWRSVEGQRVWQLIATGSVIAVAQLADFLYAPTDYILINRLIHPSVVASYAPAVQIDSALLLVAGGIAAVLLPRTALAYAAGQTRTVRQHYVVGTLISAAILAAAGLLVWTVAPTLLRIWLGSGSERLIPLILEIVPLVLLHTVIGGSSAVGRSVLLAIGRAKAYAAAALLAGAANVILSFCLVKFAGLGLKGIVYGTLIAVTARCLIWMPWYTLRAIRDPSPAPDELAATLTPPSPAA